MKSKKKLSVKALMRKAREEIDDKTFLTSSAFQNRLQRLASTSCISSTFSPIVKIEFDVSATAALAYTNGNTISVNTGCNAVMRHPTLELKSSAVIGLIAHEIGHCLYTDFKTREFYAADIRKNRFPRKGLSASETKIFAEIEAYIANSDVHSGICRSVVLNMFLQYSNILEDGWEEQHVSAHFPGTFKTGILLNGEYLSSGIEDGFKTCNPDQTDVFEIVYNAMLYYVREREFPVFPKCKVEQEARDILRRMKPIIDEALVYSAYNREVCTLRLIAIMWKYIKEYCDMAKRGDCPKMNTMVSVSQMPNRKNPPIVSDSASSSQGDGLPQSSGRGSRSKLKQKIREDAGMKPAEPDSDSNASDSGSDSSDRNNNASDCGKTDNQSGKSGGNQSHETSDANSNDSGISGSDGNSSDSDSNASDSSRSFGAGADSDTSDSKSKQKSGKTEKNQDSSKNAANENDHAADANSSSGASSKTASDSSASDTGHASQNAGNAAQARKASEDDSGSPCSSDCETADRSDSDGSRDYENDDAGDHEDSDDSAFSEDGLSDNGEPKYMDVNSIINEIAEEKCNDLLDKLSRQVLSQTSEIKKRFSSPLSIKRIREEKPELSDEKELLRIAKHMEQSIKDKLETETMRGHLTGQYIGSGVSARDLYRDDKKILMRHCNPQMDLDIAVSVLIDESGSMGGMRQNSANRAARILYRFCRDLDIPIGIYGHNSDGNNCNIRIYADIDHADDRDFARVRNSHASGCNHDGLALATICDQLLERQEQTKLCILISDGLPSALEMRTMDVVGEMQYLKKVYNRKGISLFTAAIGSDKENIQKLYGDSFLDISDLRKLPTTLVDVIKKNIKLS